MGKPISSKQEGRDLFLATPGLDHPIALDCLFDTLGELDATAQEKALKAVRDVLSSFSVDRLGNANFEGVVYARGSIYARNQIHVRGGLVSAGDSSSRVVLENGSNLTYIKELLRSRRTGGGFWWGPEPEALGRPLKARALSLLEVILALGLVPVFVLSLFFLFNRSLRLQQQADDLTRASETARLQLESIRQMPFAEVPASGVFDGRLNTPRTADGFPPAPYPRVEQDGHSYTMRVEVATGPPRAVRVDVFWGESHSTMLETTLNP